MRATRYGQAQCLDFYAYGWLAVTLTPTSRVRTSCVRTLSGAAGGTTR